VGVPYFLLVAYDNLIFQFLFCASLLVYARVDQDGFYGGVAEDDARGEEAVDYGEEDLYCWCVSLGLWRKRVHGDVRIRFHFGTSNAPMVGSSPLASVQVPTGLKDILRCRESGLASRLHGSCSSSAVTRCERDISGDFFFYMS
jgi:hypothetical protein